MSRYSRTSDVSLYIRNVDDDTRAEDIRPMFADFGPLRDVYIPLDYYTRRPRGFAYVQYEDPRDAEEACRELNGVKIHGRRLEMEFAKGDRKTPRDMKTKVGPFGGSSYRGASPSPRRRRRYRSDSHSPRRSHKSRSHSRSRSRSRSHHRHRRHKSKSPEHNRRRSHSSASGSDKETDVKNNGRLDKESDEDTASVTVDAKEKSPRSRSASPVDSQICLQQHEEATEYS